MRKGEVLDGEVEVLEGFGEVFGRVVVLGVDVDRVGGGVGFEFCDEVGRKSKRRRRVSSVDLLDAWSSTSNRIELNSPVTVKLIPNV